MKLSLLAAHGLTVTLAVGLAFERDDGDCYPLYGPNPVDPIPTVTTTITETTYPNYFTTVGTTVATVTDYPTEIPATSTVTDTITEVVTVAPSTTTVPTNPGFTPAANAQKATNPNGKKKRSARSRRRLRPFRRSREQIKNAPPYLAARLAQSGSYVTEVECVYSTLYTYTSTLTNYITVDSLTYVTVTTPGTVYQYVTEATTTTSTLQTGVATQYQGCQLASNQVSAVSGSGVALWYDQSNSETSLGRDVPDYSASGLIQTGFSHTGDPSAIQSASGCCGAAFAASCSGWAFSYTREEYSRRVCTCLEYNPADGRGWEFVTGAHSGTVVVGNGPSGVPINWGFQSYTS